MLEIKNHSKQKLKYLFEILLLLCMCFFSNNNLVAQQCATEEGPLFEDFQAWSTPTDLIPSAGNSAGCWISFDGNNSSNDTPTVESNSSGSNSFLHIDRNQSNDVLLNLGSHTTGRYELSFYIWAFSGDKAYYNILHEHTPGSSNTQWAIQVYLDGDGTGRLLVQGNTYSFTYQAGAWNLVSHSMDLDLDAASFSINDTQIHTWPFTAQSTNSSSGSNRLAWLNFFRVDNTFDFFVDEINLSPNTTIIVSVETDAIDLVALPGGNCNIGVSGDSEVTFSANFKNEGTLTSPATQALLYLSTANDDNNLGYNSGGTELIPIGVTNVISLAPNQETTVSITADLCNQAEDVDSEVYGIGILIDPEQNIDETDDTFDNNSAYCPATVNWVNTCNVDCTSFDISIDPVNPSCVNSNNGSVVIGQSGGTAPFTYSLNGAEQNSPNFNNLGVGSYSVSIVDANDCPATANFTLTNQGQIPEVDFTFNLTNLTVTFNGNILNEATNFNWDFGDGDTSDQLNTTHTYDQPGTYTVCLHASNNCGTATPECQSITVSADCSGFTSSTQPMNPTCGNANGSVTITSSGGTAPLTYFLNNGVGQNSPNFNNLGVGSYSVSIVDANDCPATANFTLTNQGQIPEVDFTFNLTNLTVTFNGNILNEATNFNWDFGDGDTSDQLNTTHTYDQSGTYTVCLSASNNCGTATPECQSITVSADCPESLLSFTDTPDDITIACNANIPQPAILVYTNNQVGECMDMGSVIATVSSGTPNPCFGHTIEYRWEISNSIGTTVHTQIITIAPAPSPEITLPNLPSQLSCQQAAGYANPPAASYSNNQYGNCAISGIILGTVSYSPADCNGGELIVRYQGTDECGGFLSRDVTIQVLSDNVPPILDVPSGLTINTSEYGCQPTVQNLGISVFITDDCSENENISITTSPTELSIGNNNIQWIATDACGNPTVRFQNIVLEDNTEPSIVCTNLVYTLNNSGTLAVNVSDLYVVNDDCSSGNSFFLDGPQTAFFDCNNSPAGINEVSISISDAFGNITTQICPVTISSAITLVGVSEVDPICTGESTQIVVNVQGGTPPYEIDYTKNNEQGTFTNTGTNIAITSNSTTIYTIKKIRDLNDCELNITSIERTVEVYQTPVVSFTSFENFLEITFTNTSTGEEPLSHTWDFGDGESSNEVNPIHTYETPGNYNVCLTVIGAEGLCESTSCNVVIAEPPCDNLVLSLAVDENATCELSNGAISSTTSGGQAPYTYLWTGGNTTANLQNVASGSYTLSVTDMNGCGAISSINIENEGNPIEIAYTFVFNSLEVIFNNNTSGTSPVYTWDFGDGGFSNEANPSHVYETAGTYTFCLTAHNDCNEEEKCSTIEVSGNCDAFIVESSSVINTTCGQSNGAITLFVDGGEPPYNYIWNNGNTSNVNTQLSAGTYEATVTDDNNCSILSGVFQIAAIDGPTASIETPLELTCSNTQVTLDASNSTGEGLSYQWLTPDNNLFGNSESVTIPEPGVYTLILTDNNNCTTVATTQVQQNIVAPIADAGADVQFTCEFNSTTLGGANTSEGSQFTYNWSSTNGFSSNQATIVVSTAGQYVLTVSNTENGCTHSDFVEVFPPIDNLILDVQIVDSECEISAGQIDIIVSGGVPPYEYYFNNAINNNPDPTHLEGLVAGNYPILVIDSNGCEIATSVNITNTDGPELDLGEDIHLCAGESQEIGPNDPNLIYQWSTGETSPVIIVESEGIYLLTVINSDSCIATDNIEITFTPEIELSIQTDMQEVVCPDEVVEIQVQATNFDDLDWLSFNTGIQPASDNLSATITPTTASTVSVVASNACFEETASITIDIFDSQDIIVVGGNIKQGEDAELMVLGGESYTWIVPPNITISCTDCSNPVISDIEENTSLDLITIDDNGCIQEKEVLIFVQESDSETVIFPVNFISPNGDGDNDVLVFEELAAYSGNSIQIFNRWGNIIYETTDYQNDWDGTFNGELLPTGSYFYILQIDELEKPIKSTLLILRE